MKRLTYLGTLRFPYGFHTGDGRRLAAVDQPLFREADGQVALAGSSLAGVLRADLDRLLRAVAGPDACLGRPECRCVVCRLLGSKARTRRGTEGGGLRASKLHVLGGRAGRGAAVRVRDRVGIDRRTRTAADRRKYDVELVDGGVEFPFQLRLDDPQADERLFLEAALCRLAGGWLFLGGKTSSGLGRAEVASLERCELDLGRPAELVRNLLADDPTAGATVTRLVPPEAAAASAWADAWDLAVPGNGQDTSGASWGQIRIHLELSFPWGFLVNDPAEALQSGFDHTYTRRTQDQPVLPGSALRGALRSRAERILRTLGGDGAACDLNRRGHACHERIERERSRCLISGDERARHCRACRLFGSGRLASAVKLTDFLPVAGGEGKPVRQEFVAVDRFTGGAAPGAKFNAEASAGVTFAGELHVEIGPNRVEGWGLGLLALVLRDLLLGDVPLGFGTAKGLNEYAARITGIDRFWVCPPLPFAGGSRSPDAATPGAASWRAPEDRPLDGPAALAQLAGKDLQDRLAAWVQALHAELASGPEVATEAEREGSHG